MKYYPYDDDDSYYPCYEGHVFSEVMDYGVISHYVCKYCNAKVSEEVYYALTNKDEDEVEDEEDDIVDDDDMC